MAVNGISLIQSASGLGSDSRTGCMTFAPSSREPL